MKPQTAEFQVVDHGIDGAQYFPGCGVAGTSFSHVATGCGDNFAEAIEDAIDMMSHSPNCSVVDFDALQQQIALEWFGTVADGKVTWQTSESALANARKANGHMSDEEWEESLDELDVYYYVSIRYNTEETGR